jgi:hypothetical protein
MYKLPIAHMDKNNELMHFALSQFLDKKMDKNINWF